jgi:hypothetical protein
MGHAGQCGEFRQLELENGALPSKGRSDSVASAFFDFSSGALDLLVSAGYFESAGTNDAIANSYEGEEL